MKTKALIQCITVAASIVFGYGAEPNERVKTIDIGLSPFYPARDVNRVQEALVQLILGAPPKTAVTIHDAWHLRSIARIEVPALRFDTPGARVRLFREPLAAIVRWFKEQTNTPTALKESAALKTPQWFSQIASPGGSEVRSIVLIGSALYCSPDEPAFDMRPDLYPTDGHFRASADETVFSILQKGDCLTNATVRWGYLTESIWANQLHADGTRRFWTLWISLQGGCLGSFSPDFVSVLKASRERSHTPVGRFQVDTNDTKPTMRASRPREIPRWMPQTVPATNALGWATNSTTSDEIARNLSESTAAPSRRLEVRSRSAGPTPSDAPAPSTALAVGLMWKGFITTDIDLYVAMPGQPELSFKHTRHARGFYHHDYVSPNWVDGERSRMSYEFVELQRPVDIRSVRAWINYYSGFTPAPSGTVVVWWQGRQYTSTFRISAMIGNHGRDAARRESSANWVEIDLLQIVGMRGEQ